MHAIRTLFATRHALCLPDRYAGHMQHVYTPLCSADLEQLLPAGMAYTDLHATLEKTAVFSPFFLWAVVSSISVSWLSCTATHLYTHIVLASKLYRAWCRHWRDGWFSLLPQEAT